MEHYDLAGNRHRPIVGTKADPILFRDERKAEKLLRRRFPEKFAPPFDSAW